MDAKIANLMAAIPAGPVAPVGKPHVPHTSKRLVESDPNQPVGGEEIPAERKPGPSSPDAAQGRPGGRWGRRATSHVAKANPVSPQDAAGEIVPTGQVQQAAPSGEAPAPQAGESFVQLLQAMLSGATPAQNAAPVDVPPVAGENAPAIPGVESVAGAPSPATTWMPMAGSVAASVAATPAGPAQAASPAPGPISQVLPQAQVQSGLPLASPPPPPAGLPVPPPPGPQAPAAAPVPAAPALTPERAATPSAALAPAPAQTSAEGSEAPVTAPVPAAPAAPASPASPAPATAPAGVMAASPIPAVPPVQQTDHASSPLGEHGSTPARQAVLAGIRGAQRLSAAHAAVRPSHAPTEPTTGHSPFHATRASALSRHDVQAPGALASIDPSTPTGVSVAAGVSEFVRASGQDQAAPAQAPATPGQPGAQPRAMLADQVVSAVLSARGDQSQQLTIRLDPPELGSIRVSLHTEKDVVRGVVHVDNPDTFKQIQREAPQLIERLVGGGIQVKQIDVQLNTNGGGTPGQWHSPNAGGWNQYADGRGQSGQGGLSGHVLDAAADPTSQDQAAGVFTGDSVNLWL